MIGLGVHVATMFAGLLRRLHNMTPPTGAGGKRGSWVGEKSPPVGTE